MMSKVLVVFASCAALANAAVAPRQTSTLGGNIISVTGTGNVDIPTTQTQVSASISKTTACDPEKIDECSGQEAQQEVNKALSDVLDYLKGVDSVSKLTTNSLSVMPEYNYTATPAELTGYTAQTSISFQVDNEEAGNVLDQIVTEGVTSIGSVSFVASDEAIDKATAEALKKAVANGQAQADAVLEAIDAKQEGIVGVQIGSAQPPVPVPMPAPVALAAAAPGAEDNAAKTTIEAGTQTVSASVTLNIKYAQ